MSTTPRRLGRIPSPPSPERMARARRFNKGDFPAPPASYDYRPKVGKGDWGVMMNDVYGDCAIAAVGHLVMLWTANSRGSAAVIPDATLKSVYFTLSPNDEGCVMEDVLNYWATKGVGGHSILGFAPVDPADDAQVFTLGWLFGGTYNGVMLPAGGTDGHPGKWTTPCYGTIGGHAIPTVADAGAGGDEYVCTWGMPDWLMSQGFRHQRCDEMYVALSADWFGADGLTPNGHKPSDMGRFLTAAGGHLLNPLPPDPSPSPSPAPPTPPPNPRDGWPDLGELV